MENATFSKELFFLIFKYLEGSNCQNAANALREEIAKHNLLPSRITWQGEEREQDLATFESRHTHIPNDFLLKVVSRVGHLLDQQIPSSIRSVNTLLGSGSQSLLRTSSDINHVNESHFLHSRLHHAPLKPSSKKAHPYSQNIVNLITSREASGPSSITSILPTYMYERFTRCKRSLGHLGCVYCVSFDRTGRFIFTGADDTLIKIWSAEDGRLLATLRDHSHEISDIAVNYENTMLATGSVDKMIRVWCLKTTSLICVLTGHTGMITSLSFCPNAQSDNRFLVSTSNDGSICFWKYQNSKQKFDPVPHKKVERVKQSAHLLCFSFSSGGSFLAVGSSDHYVRVYHMIPEKEPNKILEIQPHLDQVDSLQFSNTGLRFISGSKDGTANIWTFERSEWHNKTLHMNETLPNAPSTQPNADQNPVAVKLKVTMVGWSLDDRYAITAANDHSIKVWESNSGKLKYILKEHEDEVFVIETHPTDPRIFLSGGNDGRIFLWDLSSGRRINMFYNQIPGQGYGSIFDCKWSPDGSMFACTDSHGQVSIFTYERSDKKYQKVPDEVFFHTDYRPLIRDSNHYVIDEQTLCAPHLMPPPFLVDIDGNPYPPALQRLVPGREHYRNKDQLVPATAAALDQSLSSNRPGAQRSDDVEGIRQSNYQSNDLNAFNRKYVPPLPENERDACYRKLFAYSQLEEEIFRKQSMLKPLPIATALKELTRKKKRVVIQQRGIRESNANLYVTEEELQVELSKELSEPDDNDDVSFSITEAELRGSSSSSESESDSSDTDWEPNRKRNRRKVVMNQANSSDSDEEHQPVIEQQSPPESELDSSMVQLDSPMVQQDSPTLQLDSRTVQLDSRTVQLDSPTVQLDSPTVQLDSPTVQLDNPTVQLDNSDAKAAKRLYVAKKRALSKKKVADKRAAYDKKAASKRAEKGGMDPKVLQEWLRDNFRFINKKDVLLPRSEVYSEFSKTFKTEVNHNFKVQIGLGIKVVFGMRCSKIVMIPKGKEDPDRRKAFPCLVKL